MAAQTLWHRRVAKQAVRSASGQEAIRTGVISLRVPRIAPLVLNAPAPAYSEPAEMDIQSPTSPPPGFDTLEPGPRHHDYTPYIPSGLENEPLDEPVQGPFNFFTDAANNSIISQDLINLYLNPDGIRRSISLALGDVSRDTHPTSIVELPPSHNCNFAYYRLLPPRLDPGPAAPSSYPLPYPPCNSVDCWAVEHVGVLAHDQGPYQDPSIPKALHGFLNSSLEAQGLKDLFQSGSIPAPEVWNALHRIIDGTAERVNGSRESATSDWALIENFRAWHCFGHRSVEELCDTLAENNDSEASDGEGDGGSKFYLVDTEDDDDSGSEARPETGVCSWMDDL